LFFRCCRAPLYRSLTVDYTQLLLSCLPPPPRHNPSQDPLSLIHMSTTCSPLPCSTLQQLPETFLSPLFTLELFTTEQHPLHPHQFFPPSLLSLVPSLPFCSALTSYAHRPSLNQCTTQQMDHSGVDRESGWTLCRLPLCSLSLPLLSLQMTHPHQPFADSFEERKQRECPSRLSRFSLLFFGESVCRNQ
jgi:hypothetical protein